MRHLRYPRHRRHNRYERHGDALQSFIDGPLAVSIPANKSVATGAALTIAATATGGFTPYTYVWKKGGTVVSGQTSATLNIASADSGDSGSYTCEVTDAKGTVVASSACVVTVTA